jgi:hypothetical protein
MSIPYTQATMAQVRAVDGTFISHPFLEIGDTATKVYNLLCTQRASDYDSAQIALDAPMTNATTAGVISLPSGWADATAYFVGDTGHSAIDGGMIEFNRTFANIPAYSRITRGSYGYTFPGLNNFTEETAQSSDISAISMALGTVGIRVITDDTMTLAVGISTSRQRLSSSAGQLRNQPQQADHRSTSKGSLQKQPHTYCQE